MSQRVQRLGWTVLVVFGAWLAMSVAAGATAGPAGEIRGTVTEAGIGPVAGVQVTATSPDGGYASGTTEADGTYILGGTTDETRLPAGSYTVSFTTYDPYRTLYYGNTLDEADAAPVVLTDVEGAVGIDAVWTGISGTMKRPDGVGVASGSVTALDPASTDYSGYVASAYTDAQGNYELWVPAGNYDLFYSATEGAGGQFYSGNATSQADAAPVTVTETNLTDHDVQFTAVKGQMTGPGGTLRGGYVNVHPGADVNFEDGMFAGGLEGTYEVWVAPGSYRVQFSDEDTFTVQYYPGTRNPADSTTVTTSAASPIATANATWHRIAGSVTWIDGTPDTKANVSLLEPELETYDDP